MTPLDESLKGWTTTPEVSEEYLAPAPALALAATLDRDPASIGDGAPLPPLWHWAYFTPKAPRSAIGPDGHPRRGGFLPPIDLPRRMFAGVDMTFHRPLLLGRPTQRRAEVTGVEFKQGRQGQLAFVTVAITYSQDGTPCLEETQTIVYREAGGTVPPLDGDEPPAAPAGAWTELVRPDPVLLFRFSALTFNGHRIHYDRPYATEVEGYPALVVHGPLVAMLLAELAGANAPRPLRSFTFRAAAPIFDTAPFRLVGIPGETGADLHALRCDGQVAVKASVTY